MHARGQIWGVQETHQSARFRTFVNIKTQNEGRSITWREDGLQSTAVRPLAPQMGQQKILP